MLVTLRPVSREAICMALSIQCPEWQCAGYLVSSVQSRRVAICMRLCVQCREWQLAGYLVFSVYMVMYRILSVKFPGWQGVRYILFSVQSGNVQGT